MNCFSIEHLIVYTFLVATLLIGLWAGRGIKNIREYAIANKMYGTGVLTITFLATFLGGQNTIGIQKTILSYGLVAGVAIIGTAIMFLYAGAFIVPKMLRFYRCITLGDMMHELYGLQGGIITGVMGGVYTIIGVGVQILALGAICQSLLGWRTEWSIGLGGAILILYASWGGVKSVTITDVFQFIFFVIVIPIIANLAISKAGGIQAILNNLPADKFTVYGHKEFLRYLTPFIVWGLFPAALSVPPITQRILMAQNRQQATNMLFISAAFILVVRVLVLFGSLAVLLLAPNIEPSTGGTFAYVINKYFSPALRGFSVAGLLAIVMSTLDSFLNAGGLLVTRNVLKPYWNQRKVALNELQVVRYITFLLGCAGILFAFAAKEARTLNDLNYFGIAIFASVITLPFIAGVLGLKTDTRSFLISSAVTIATFILSHLCLPAAFRYLEFPISLTANAISFFAAHIVKHQGIVTVKIQAQERGLHPPQSHGGLHTLFALLMCFAYMLPYGLYIGAGVVFAIRFIGAILCVGLLLKPYWGEQLQKYFYAYWHFTLFYCLPFSTTLLYVLNGVETNWGNVAVSIMLLVTLANWRTFVIISLAGVVLGLLCAFGIQGHIFLFDEYLYTLAYTSIASTFVGALIGRNKGKRDERQQKMLEAESATAKAILLGTAEEKDKAMKTLKNTGIHSLLEVAKKLQELKVEPGDVGKLHTIEEILIPMAFQLQNIDTGAQKYLRLQVDTVTIDQLLAKVREKLKNNGIAHPILAQKAAKRKELVCDLERLTTLISNSVAALQKQTESLQEEEKDPIFIGLEDTKLLYPLPDVAEGYVKKVKALRIVVTTENSWPSLEPSYQPDLTTAPITDHPTTAQEIEQMANERIVKAHYGHAEVVPNTFCYVIPRKIRKVRPKDMDKPYMEFGAAPVRANDLYKSDTIDAQAQEKEFLEVVAQRSSAEIGLVKMALELIKWYHGPASRHSGEPFYLHPLSVAQIVLDYNTDEPTILGALLHDTVEDTAMLLPHIETVFGSETAAVVDAVTHLQSQGESPYKIKLSEEENLQMLSRIGNTRALYVKVADRLHNMRTIHARPYERQLHRAQETLDFFVPLAERLGLKQAAEEMRSRCEEVLSRSPQTSSMRT